MADYLGIIGLDWMGWHIDGGMGSCQDIKLFELYKTELNMVCVCDVEFNV
jgi:hypothetical protein